MSDMTPEKAIAEAAAMRAAVAGDATDGFSHAANWADKPSRVVHDACRIIETQAAELTRLRAKVEAADKLAEAVADIVRTFPDTAQKKLHLALSAYEGAK